MDKHLTIHQQPRGGFSVSRTIDYYLAPQSPWTYLGHTRLVAMAQGAAAEVRVRPVDLGRVFPVSGGLPLGKRAPQRQAYRLLELRRFADHLAIPLNLEPRYFPVAGDDAARLIIAARQAQGSESALRLAGAVLAAVWEQERNIADPLVLQQLLQEQGLPAQLVKEAVSGDVQKEYDDNTAAAIAVGVFGAPTYCVDGEMFWGQDRLEFLARRLARN